MEKFLSLSQAMLDSFLASCIVFVFILAAKYIIDYQTRKTYSCADELMEKNNVALAIRNSGLYIGIGIAMSASFDGNYIQQIINGIATLVMMMLSLNITTKLIVDMKEEEIKNKNVSMGLTAGAIYLATGIIAYGSFTGAAPLYVAGIFFVLGQALLIVMSIAFEKLNKGTKEGIKKGNLSSGILLSGIIIAYALILKAAVEGNFVSWSQDLIAFSISGIFGLLMLLLLANKVIDSMFLYHSSISQEIKDENPAAMIIISAIKIAIAYVISSVII